VFSRFKLVSPLYSSSRRSTASSTPSSSEEIGRRQFALFPSPCFPFPESRPNQFFFPSVAVSTEHLGLLLLVFSPFSVAGDSSGRNRFRSSGTVLSMRLARHEPPPPFPSPSVPLVFPSPQGDLPAGYLPFLLFLPKRNRRGSAGALVVSSQ